MCKCIFFPGGLFLLLLTLATAPFLAKAQTTTADSSWIRKSSLVVLPIAFYTPETRLGGGAAGIFAFRFRGEPDSLRPSQLQAGLAYTLEDQLLAYLPFQIFYNEGQYNSYGEIGYYRYFYRYFGLGNQTSEADEEIYNAVYPRLRLNVLQRVRPNLYLGFRYWFDNYKITERAENGELRTNTITGSRGGVISALGAVVNYDSRDDIFFPGKGALIESVWLYNTQSLGSDFNFNRFSIDATTYHTFSWKHILAVNAFTDMTFGEVPFFQLAFIGGTKKMRGYWEGRFRDKKLWMLQTEYRLPLFWRLGAVVFGGMGSVAPSIGAFAAQEVHYNYGAGLRIRLSDTEKINVRIDVGIDETGNWFPYLTVGEAF